MPHPKNFRRSWFHARDYGLLVANPFGNNAFTRGKKSQLKITPEKPLRLRFGILLHSSPKNDPPDLAAAYKDYLAQTATKSQAK